jgi:hypothetical protein
MGDNERRMNANCTECHERLGELLEWEDHRSLLAPSDPSEPLSAFETEMETLWRHAQECAHCRSDLRLMREARAALRAVAPLPAPPDLRARVRARLAAEIASAPTVTPAATASTAVPEVAANPQASAPQAQQGGPASWWKSWLASWSRPSSVAWAGGGLALAALCVALVSQLPSSSTLPSASDSSLGSESPPVAGAQPQPSPEVSAPKGTVRVAAAPKHGSAGRDPKAAKISTSTAPAAEATPPRAIEAPHPSASKLASPVIQPPSPSDAVPPLSRVPRMPSPNVRPNRQVQSTESQAAAPQSVARQPGSSGQTERARSDQTQAKATTPAPPATRPKAPATASSGLASGSASKDTSRQAQPNGAAGVLSTQAKEAAPRTPESVAPAETASGVERRGAFVRPVPRGLPIEPEADPSEGDRSDAVSAATSPAPSARDAGEASAQTHALAPNSAQRSLEALGGGGFSAQNDASAAPTAPALATVELLPSKGGALRFRVAVKSPRDVGSARLEVRVQPSWKWAGPTESSSEPGFRTVWRGRAKKGQSVSSVIDLTPPPTSADAEATAREAGSIDVRLNASESQGRERRLAPISTTLIESRLLLPRP